MKNVCNDVQGHHSLPYIRPGRFKNVWLSAEITDYVDCSRVFREAGVLYVIVYK